MKKPGIFYVIFSLFLFSIGAFAQDTKHVAFVFKEDLVKSPWNKQLYEKIKLALHSTPGLKPNVYLKNEDDKGLKFQKDTLGQETMSGYIAYILSDINRIQPDYLIVKKTDEGKVLRVLHRTQMKLDIKLRIIDLSTSEILTEIAFNENDLPSFKRPGTTVKIDYKKYFPASPDDKNISSSEYAAILKKIRKDYAKEIYANQKAQLDYILNNTGYKLKRELRKKVVSRDFSLSVDVQTDMTKLKDLILEGGKKEGIEGRDRLSVFVKRKIQDDYYWASAGGVSVHEVQDNTARVSHTGRKTKEELLAKALQDNTEVVVTYSNLPAQELSDRSEMINVAEDRRVSVYENIANKGLVYNLPGARVIERAPDYDLEYFIEKSKQEAFMDQASINMVRQVGVEYLLEITPEQYKLVDIKTSKILFVTERSQSLFGIHPNYDFINKWNDYFDTGIELIEVLDGNEKKVKDIMVQSMLDLRNMGTLDVFHVQSEKIGGKTIDRLVEVGTIWVKKDLGGNLFECKVTNGEKELRKLIDNGEKLKIKLN